MVRPALLRRWVKALIPAERSSRSWISRAKNAYDLRQLPDAVRAEAMLRTPGAARLEAIEGRICYALSSSPPQISGYSTRTQGMAAGLRYAGLDVVGLTRPGYPWDRDIVGGSGPDLVDGVAYHRIPGPLRGAMPQRAYVEASIPAWESAIASLRPMVVLAASNWESALPAAIAARRLGLPFFYELRGFWEMTRASEEEGFETTSLYAAQARLEALVAASADHVFTLTSAMREELMRRGVPAERITILPNRCDPADFEPRAPDAELAETLGLIGGVPVVGYVGSLLKYEGLELLIDACGMLARAGQEFRLLIVGSEPGGTGAYSQRLRERAEAAGLGRHLIMPGRVPHRDVPRYYSLIDITPFARTSHLVTETVSPLKPLEAMAMGKAVVLSDVGGMRGMVEDGLTGRVVRSGSVADLARALGTLIGAPEDRRRLGNNARATAEAEQGWRTNGLRARDAMRSVGDSQPGPVVESLCLPEKMD